jgi:GTP-binding protein LepA
VEHRDMQEQLLDNMEIERERGITIKLQAVRMNYKAKNGETYLLNLIDTPGHVDFGYEVSRSLAACEGVLLVVDATQGVEAQTIANVYLAIENNLEIIPIINKIDLPTADPEKVKEEVENTLSLDCSEAISCSAKTGENIEAILEAIVERLPSPSGSLEAPLQALIFDSYYDSYRGIIILFRVINGSLRKGDFVHFMNSGIVYEVLEIGVMSPKQTQVDELRVGEVGYLAANIKSFSDASVGDTITSAKNRASSPLPGYSPVKSMVYAGLYTSDTNDYERLKDALYKLKLNDASLTFIPEISEALGFGFRCGFLGLLHMDVIQERLEKEYDLDIVVTAPSVIYKVEMNDGTMVEIDTPSKLPEPTKFTTILEPFVRLEIISPSEHVGSLMELAQNRRGTFQEMKYLSANRVSLVYEVSPYFLFLGFLPFFLLLLPPCRLLASFS